MQVAQRWILARLRNRRIFSQANLNAAIRRLAGAMKLRVSREGIGVAKGFALSGGHPGCLQPQGHRLALSQ